MPETVPLTLPAMGESVTEGTVVNWVKKAGDAVTEGETLVEVTTDKVDVEVPSPASGTLAEITAPEGETVLVGGTLGPDRPGPRHRDRPRPGRAPWTSRRLRSAGPRLRRRPTRLPRGGRRQPAPRAAGRRACARAPPSGSLRRPTRRPAAKADHVRLRRRPHPRRPTPGAPAPAPRHLPPPASPLARRQAALAGVDLATLQGTGPGGMIRRDDVAVTAPGRRRAPATPSAVQPPAPAAGAPTLGPGETGTPIRGPQAALVEAMERSRDIPTATSIRTIPVGLLDTRRRQLNAALARAGRDLKVSFTHLIGFAVARAAAEMPGMLIHFARDAEGRPLRVEGGVHLGLAVDTRRRDGSRFLVVPVLRDAGGRDFAGFRAEYERLVAGRAPARWPPTSSRVPASP